MSEAAFERKCMKELGQLPNSFWFPKGDPGAILGNPDRVGCICGTLVSLEFKASEAEMLKKTKRRALQHYNIIRVKEAGGYAAFVYPEIWNIIYTQLKEIAWRSQNKPYTQTLKR